MNYKKLTFVLFIALYSSVACVTNVQQSAKIKNDNTQLVEIKKIERPIRLFLQQISSNSAILKWRGSANQACIIKESGKVNTDTHCGKAVNSENNHKEVYFNHLTPDTSYKYTVGSYSEDLYRFQTAPDKGKLPKNGNVRIWIIGDSGTAIPMKPNESNPYSDDAQKVLDGYLSYQSNHPSPLNLFLMLGDNAYEEGTDAEWQSAVFELYPTLLSQSALWPTIGNHEMGSGEIDIPDHGKVFSSGISLSSNPDSYVTKNNLVSSRMPYLDIFTLPTRGEVGGVPSGTEQYYSFDYSNLHIVSLDSQLSARNEILRSAMKEWLISDLSASTQQWTIVIFHHAPYSKGSHDSDVSDFGIDQPMIDMREEFTSVFEDYGVDMVYSGHSHSYERSYYLNGHRGVANTFNATKHAELNQNSAPAVGYGNEEYYQTSPSSHSNDKVVYTVAGSSGYVSLGEGKLDHPAHVIQKHDIQKRRGLSELGSVVIDATSTQLIAHFINQLGEIKDTVTINR